MYRAPIVPALEARHAKRRPTVAEEEERRTAFLDESLRAVGECATSDVTNAGEAAFRLYPTISTGGRGGVQREFRFQCMEASGCRTPCW
jgi:hypothetical protein